MHATRPSAVRHAVVACAVVMSLLLYLDRFCVSFAEIYMKQDLGLSDAQVGWMFSAFFWAYALAQVPSGWLTDRFGARLTLTAYILGWSLFTGIMGLAQGIGLLLVARFLCGVFQAGAYPSSASLLSRWVPLTSRGLASSLVALGGRAGGALAPLLTALLIVAFVPVEYPSTFAPDDVLRPQEFGLLWKESAASADSETPDGTTATEGDSLRSASRPQRARAAASWLYRRLPAELQRRIRSLETAERNGNAAGLRSDGRTLLADVLNYVLDDDQLAQQSFVIPAELSREAQALMRRARSVQAESATDKTAARGALSPLERQRLNRLILEALFPDDLRRVYMAGWRKLMFTYGLLGVPVALAFWFVFRNSPLEHPWCNAQERAWISQGRDEQPAKRPIGGAPLGALLTHPSMWCNSISQFATNIGWIFLVTWLPRYLDEVHRVPIERRAVMTLIPVLVGFVGLVLGGRLTDRLVRVLGLRWGRALPMGLSKFVAAVAYLVCLTRPSAELCVVLFALVALASDLGIGAIWAYAQDVGGRHVGSVLGWANMWGNIGAAIGPPLLIAVIGKERNWDLAFLVAAGAYLVAAASALAINAEKPLLTEEPK